MSNTWDEKGGEEVNIIVRDQDIWVGERRQRGNLHVGQQICQNGSQIHTRKILIEDEVVDTHCILVLSEDIFFRNGIFVATMYTYLMLTIKEGYRHWSP